MKINKKMKNFVNNKSLIFFKFFMSSVIFELQIKLFLKVRYNFFLDKQNIKVIEEIIVISNPNSKLLKDITTKPKTIARIM